MEWFAIFMFGFMLGAVVMDLLWRQVQKLRDQYEARLIARLPAAPLSQE